MSKNVFIARSNEPINYMELNHMECRQAVNHYFCGKAIYALLWRMSESNRRPPACKAGALAS